MKYYIGAGSNLGDRTLHMLEAFKRITNHFPKTQTAPLMETPPLLPEGAPDDWYLPFMNSVFSVETDLPPVELLKILKTIEREMGRSSDAPRWAPRPIDLDILLRHDNQVFQDASLTMPIPSGKIAHSP